MNLPAGRPISLNLRTLQKFKAHAAADPGREVEPYLNRALRMLAIWRSTLLANTIVARHGTRILGGPFAGMEYVSRATEGALTPRLLGTYESELHPALAEFAASDLDVVIDIGCAEGYYAVGLARLMPDVIVHAHDIDERARAACTELAAKNGVAERVKIGGEFKPTDFASYRGQKVLVLIDAEGAEDEILDPAILPDLAHMSLIVETHPAYRQAITERMCARFAPTHDIEVIRQAGKGQVIPEWIGLTGHLDQLIAVWEFRGRPTPWLVMRPKAKAQD